MNTGSSIRTKEVINVADGRKLGHVADMEFTCDGHIKSLTIPGAFSVSAFLRGERCDLIIPWSQVVLIGMDAILVDIGCENLQCE